MRNHLPYIIISCAMIFSYSQAKAQVKGNPQLKTPTVRQPAIQKSSSKLSTDLKKVYENYGAGERKAESKAKPVQPNSGLDNFIQIKGDQVLVDITVKGDSKTARAELEKMGVKVNGVFGRVISGMIPIKALPQLESAKNVHFARPAYKPMHQFQPAGSIMNKEKPGGKITPVVTQGDTAQRSYLARKKRHREKRSVNGTGVKVGILSDSYNNLGTADIGVKRGELPGPANPFRYKKPVQVLLDLDSNGRDEGRGMMEIIHDVAPGAELAFNTAFIGQAAFAQGILDLAAAGCKVITDDVTYFEEPFFQDGIVAQAVDMVKQKGVTYFASAGNNSVRSYESNYRSSDYSPFGVEAGTAHNFSPPGDPPVYFQPIFIPTGGEFIISFQYDQPFFSAGGAGAESDLDIYLLDSLGNIVAGGFSDNILRGDPVEIFSYLNGNENNTYYLAILKFSGPDPSRLKYIFFGQGLFYLTNPPIPGILAPTIIGHAKAEGAITTAAVFFLETPAYGLDTPLVEPFSSVGGVANYFDIEGNRIAPLVRKKPEITAPDGGNTSFFPPGFIFGNQDIREDTDTFPNFFGTSAAAPHAAGVAALMIDAQHLNTITPGQIKGVLSANTVDMDDVWNTPEFDEGFDFNTGTGLIKADAAVKEVRFPNLYVKNLKLEAICSDNPATSRNWKIINPNSFEVQVNWMFTGSSQRKKLVVPPGGSTTITTQTVYYHNTPVPNVVIIDWEDNFGFTRFDLEYSTRATCGKEAVSKNNNDRILDEEVAIETMDKSNNAIVYPNPSSKFFRLYLSFDRQGKVDIDLYRIDGKKLYAKTVPSSGIVDIDASTYAPGVYVLRVRQGKLIKTFKIIRQ